MCPTPLGRVQTRILILILPALIGLVVSLATGNWGYVALVGLYLVMGAFLDLALYGWIVWWQPPWLTGLLGLAEYVLLLMLALSLGFDIPIWAATVFYVGVWLVAQAVRIALLPLIFLTRIEDGGEVRRLRWTVSPRLEQVPVIALGGEALPARLSGVWSRPSQMGQALPAPSQVGRIPPEFLAELERARP